MADGDCLSAAPSACAACVLTESDSVRLASGPRNAEAVPCGRNRRLHRTVAGGAFARGVLSLRSEGWKRSVGAARSTLMELSDFLNAISPRFIEISQPNSHDA